MTVPPPLFPIFQTGVRIETATGITVTAFLTKGLNLTPEYITEKIQTLFMDGHPVDAPDNTLVINRSVIALSGAMPGLMGATLRKQGVLKGFRMGISHDPSKGLDAKQALSSGNTGIVTLKIFNLLIADIGRELMRKGFWMLHADAVKICPEHILKTSEKNRAAFVCWT